MTVFIIKEKKLSQVKSLVVCDFQPHFSLKDNYAVHFLLALEHGIW